MSRIAATLLATLAGLVVFGAALAIGACVWLLGPIQFEIYADFQTSATGIQSLAQELEANPAVSSVRIEPSPASSLDDCGDGATRLLATTKVPFFNLRPLFQEFSARTRHAGRCGGSGFVLTADDLQSAHLLAYGSLPMAAAVLALLVIARRRPALWRHLAGWTPRRSHRANVAAGGIGAAAMVLGQYAVLGAAESFGLPHGSQPADPAPAALLIALLPVTVIAAPIVEEYAFRGIIMERYLRHLPTWVALLIGAAVFAAAHSPEAIEQFATLLATGLVLGGLWILTRSLLAVVTAHALHNAAVTLISTF